MSGWKREPSSFVKKATASGRRVTTRASFSVATTSSPAMTPRFPSKGPPVRTVSMWLPIMTGGPSVRPLRTPTAFPMPSIVTASPSSRIQRTTWSRPALSSSVRASRQTPPPGSAPRRASSSSRRERRPPSISRSSRMSPILSGATGSVPLFPVGVGDAAHVDGARRRRVPHREPHPPHPVERLERARHRPGGGHEADLADPLRAEGTLRLGVLDEDDLHPRHVLGAQDAEVAELERDGHPVLAGELLGQRVAEAHVHRALDLRLALLRVDGAADIMRGDYPLQLAGPVEHHHLRRPAERGVRLHLAVLRLAGGGRVVDQDLSDVLAPGEVRERPPPVEIGVQLRRRVDGGASAEERRARARGLAGAELEARVHARPEDRRGQSEERRVGKECRSRWSPY